MFVDRFATDSYQNVLCSLVQFPVFVEEYKRRSERQGGGESQGHSTAPTRTEAPDDGDGKGTDPDPDLRAAGKGKGDDEVKMDDDAVIFPSKLTIVSHEFKRSRFLDLHLPAMRWGRETHYVGINPPFDAVKMAEVEIGDRLRGYGAWEKDLYGVGDALSKKRTIRGWDGDVFKREVLRRLPEGVKTDLERVVFFEGEEDLTALYKGRVPWE